MILLINSFVLFEGRFVIMNFWLNPPADYDNRSDDTHDWFLLLAKDPENAMELP